MVTNTVSREYLLQERKEGGSREGKKNEQGKEEEISLPGGATGCSLVPPLHVVLCGLNCTLTSLCLGFPFENWGKTVLRLCLEMEAEKGQQSHFSGLLAVRCHTHTKDGCNQDPTRASAFQCNGHRSRAGKKYKGICFPHTAYFYFLTFERDLLLFSKKHSSISRITNGS